MPEYHIPALLKESVDSLEIKENGTYVDLTFGGGGHSREILSRLGKKGRLAAFDQDEEAMANLPDDKRLLFIHNNFMFMRGCLRAAGIERADGILADLGVSFHHFDARERGFSFRDGAENHPLDMRMNRRAKTTAATLVNTLEPAALARIFGEYGELQHPFRIAASIEKYRTVKPVATVADFIEAVRPMIPRAGESKFLAKLFQSLRIELNREMEALKMALEQSLKMLAPGGILAVITYHSLEDRLVKNFFKTGNFDGTTEKDFYGNVSSPFEVLTKKGIVPGEAEVAANSRSRSAKLRVARKSE